jgi:hypothetical protein
LHKPKAYKSKIGKGAIFIIRLCTIPRFIGTAGSGGGGSGAILEVK